MRTLLAAWLLAWACGSVAQSFSTDVPGVEESMLAPAYWLAGASDGVRLSPARLAQWNARNLADDPYLMDPLALGDALSGTQLARWLSGVSSKAGSPRFFRTGEAVTEADWARWQSAARAEQLPAKIPVRFGLVVTRAALRSFPTDEKIYKAAGDWDLDRFQESGVFPGEAVALLHESADGHWWFVRHYHYAAWIRKSAVAEASREQVAAFVNAPDRLMITGAQVHTNFNPEEPRSSRVLLDMGVSLPRLRAAEVGHSVNGQNPYASHIVQLPVRNADGSLALVPTLIARSQDVQAGALPLTEANILRQSFKFLGERYGWGHDYYGRDCTGFVGEVYRSMGLLMPRNSGQQGRSKFAPGVWLDGRSRDEKLAAIAQLRIGDLIYIPGHVMLYIGEVKGEPYVIHDVTGLSYFTGNAAGEQSLYTGTLSGVSVTPLKPLRLNEQQDFIDAIYAIKTISE
ncbi:SH3 domain-containing protein [Simiduia agarivorans]|uniref:NLP/P60 protein n=1 Tax=Simiduia agarivorans (strain DSM 21679 / JCM 13881 / BCRC 17597 / SA1) TaxID=1117647 RepID=K4KKI4_SIMAS|nr:SH3 domain-containing protein [Simiduia agarivorans]AFU98720.1 NLP/P60 protein [Simiduia agarivorans SA1 = DSM 21679]